MSKRAATGGYDPSGIDLEAWTELEEQLEATIPNYDRVNRLMTFGQDKRWRRNVRNHATKGMKVLEVGCGPGSFAEDLVGRIYYEAILYKYRAPSTHHVAATGVVR